MKLKPVTDPNILAALNGDDSSPKKSSLRPVTDPDILSQLEKKEGGENNFNPSFLEKLAPNILAGLANMGHGIVNAPHNIGKYLTGSNNIPHLPDYNYSSMLNIPNTQSDQFVQGAAESLPAMLMPAARLGQAGNLISKIPMAGKYLEGAASRLLPQIGLGAATSDNVGQGAKNAALAQSIGEILPIGLKGIAKAAEIINPRAFSKKLGEMFTQDFTRARSKASQYYKQVTDKIGNVDIYSLNQANVPTYKNLNQNIIDRYFPMKVKKLHEDFMQDQNLNNAHLLLKQLGSEGSKFSNMKNDPMASAIADAMQHSYKILDNDIKSFIYKKDPILADKWQRGIDIFRTEAAPYLSNSPLHDLATGKRMTISPAQAQNLLTRSVEKGKIDSGHYISQALGDLNRKIERGKAINSLIPPLVKNLSPLPGILDFSGNPYIQENAKNLYPYYEHLKNAMINSKLQGQ